MLELNDVVGGYGDIRVLHGVSLTVGAGEVLGLLGPNGHGKSTLLKAIAGVHPATGGSIRFIDEEIRTVPSHEIVERGIAYIAEERHLFNDMTVKENLALGAYPQRARPKIAENLERAYELFPRLADRRTQLCGTLSGGESRMVAIARGLMSDAQLLMVDEPSIGLAPAVKDDVYEAIHEINRELGITVLLVEQEIEHALRLAGRIYVLKHGEVFLEADRGELGPAELREAYF